MKKEAVYRSPQQALFEAWLRGGVYYEDDGLYRILSKPEAKNRMRDFVEKKKYVSVKRIADQLKSPITLSDKSASISLRVPFITYAKLVESALNQRASLSTLVRNSMIQELEEFIAQLRQERGIIPQNTEMLQKAFQAWKIDSSKPEEGSKDFYSLSKTYYPGMEREVIKLILEKAERQIRKRCPGVQSEVLDRYLKINWKNVIDEVYEDWPEYFEQKLSLNEAGQLVLNIEFHSFLELDMDIEEYVALNKEVASQYGYETTDTIKAALGEVDEEWAAEVGTIPLFFDLILLSFPLSIKRGKLLINNIAVEDRRLDEEVKRQYRDNLEKQLATLSSKLDAATAQEDWDKVSAVSEDLVYLKKDSQILDYCLEIAIELLRKTQVVSVRAPEVIIRAWEACCKMEFENWGVE